MEVSVAMFAMAFETDLASLYLGFERQIGIKQGLVSPGLFDLFDVFTHSDFI